MTSQAPTCEEWCDPKRLDFSASPAEGARRGSAARASSASQSSSSGSHSNPTAGSSADPTVARGGDGTKTAASPDSGEGLSSYELERQANIAANKAKMQALGLGGRGSQPDAETPSGPKKRGGSKRKPLPAVEGSRRSKRAKGQAPDYTGEAIDRFGEELDRQMASRARGGATGALGRPDKPTIDTIVVQNRELLEAARSRLAARAGLGDQAPGNPASPEQLGYKQASISRWGPRVGAANVTDWELYYKSRMSNPPPESPYMLLQEIFAPDAWKLLISCVLMSRVSSADTKHTCIGGFFERYVCTQERHNALLCSRRMIGSFIPYAPVGKPIRRRRGQRVSNVFVCPG